MWLIRPRLRRNNTKSRIGCDFANIHAFGENCEVPQWLLPQGLVDRWALPLRFRQSRQLCVISNRWQRIMPDDEAILLDLNDFRYFVLIVESGGLTAASRNMNVPKSTVSYRLQQLETSLGVRLINRTSRSQSVTDAGAVFYKHAAEMLERAEFAESEVRQRLLEPSGVIKFTTAVATSLFALRPILPEFIRRYPKIQIVQHTSDSQVDIVGGSYDLAIREPIPDRCPTRPWCKESLRLRLGICLPPQATQINGEPPRYLMICVSTI